MNQRKNQLDSQQGTVLYVGNFLTAAVKNQRALSSQNPAGSNRMERIAQAIRAGGLQTTIVSPAASMRMGWTGKIFHPQEVVRESNLPVVYAPTIGLPFIGMLLSPWAILLTVVRLVRTRRVITIVLYNFNLSHILLAACSRFVLRVPVIHNVEDVSVPRISDWALDGRARPIQQLTFWGCMHAVARLACGFIIPTRRFLKHLPVEGKANLVVTGCLKTAGQSQTSAQSVDNRPLRILVSGKLEPEHGSDIVAEIIRLSDSSRFQTKLEFHVTGAGVGQQDIIDAAAGSGVRVCVHGFVTRNDYEDILFNTDVCLVLQRPEGRYATLKTPSKAYEFIGNGKMIITTNVGDLADLPGEFVSVVAPSAKTILEILETLAADSDSVASGKLSACRFAKEEFDLTSVGPRIVSFLKTTTAEFQGVAFAERPGPDFKSESIGEYARLDKDHSKTLNHTAIDSGHQKLHQIVGKR